MTRLRLDAIVAPTGSPAWPTDLVNGDHFLGASSTPAAVAGYPSITVPAGDVHGLPVGLSFIGRAWSEPKLIALAYAYEQATKHRQPPKFLATVAGTERAQHLDLLQIGLSALSLAFTNEFRLARNSLKLLFHVSTTAAGPTSLRKYGPRGVSTTAVRMRKPGLLCFSVAPGRTSAT